MWKVGNGKEIRFWEDKWVGNLELKNKFPRLFSLCGDKDKLLECCGVWEEGEWNWELGWRRNLFEWEKLQVGQLIEEIRGLSIVPDIDDSWVWRDGTSTKCSVKSAYSVLKGHSEAELSKLYNFFWSIKALPAAQVLAWRVLENKIATKVNLARRGVTTDVLFVVFAG